MNKEKVSEEDITTFERKVIILAIADENGYYLFSFSKAFEPILRHVLHDKMTPLYLVICYVLTNKLLQNDRT